MSAPVREIPPRSEVIRGHKSSGGRVAAVLPIHYPRALLRAFDILPVEVWGPPGIDTTAGDEHLQAYTCSIVRSALAFQLSGGLDPADLIVVPHTCDSLQGISSLWLDLLVPDQPVLTFYLPRAGTDTAQEFLAAELRANFGRLVDLTGERPSTAQLLAAIRREEEADRYLARLLREGLGLPDRQRYRLARSREYLPAELFCDLTGSALASAPGVPGPGIPLLLSGIVPEPMAVLDAIAGAGGRIVADDFACLGRRLYPAGTSDDPFMRMAQRLLAAPPDSTRGSTVAARIAHLEDLYEQSGANAVVFYGIKFCEPEQLYLPQIRAALSARGIRSVTVEVDVSESHSHQVDTRLQALMEVLS